MRTPWPAPPAFAIAALGMLVQERTDWNIYGGNIASTLAGEYSFEIALALALFALGALAYTLDTGKRPWLPAVLIAAGDHVAHRRRDLRRASPRCCSGWCARRAARGRSRWRSARSGSRSPRCGRCRSSANRRTRRACATPRCSRRAARSSCRTGSSCPNPVKHTIEGLVRGVAHQPRRDRQGDLADAVVAVVDLDPRRASRSSPPVGTGAARRSCCC